MFVDRKGTAERLPAPPRRYLYPRLSPDGARIAVGIVDADGQQDVWIYDVRGNLLNQLTFDGGERPLWSPDGREVAFLKDNAIWVAPADFSGTPALLAGTEVAGNLGPESWSPDGDVLLFASNDGIHAWRRDDAGQDRPGQADVIVARPDNGVNVGRPEFSPDGRWFVYVSDEVGNLLEIYARSYPPGSASRQRLTTEGAYAPMWVRSRGELIFQEVFTLRLQAMPIVTEPALTRSTPVPLFSEQEVGANLETSFRRNFDVAADGERFVIVGGAALTGPVGTAEALRVNVVLNWFEELRARVPVN